jgi:hypothetical protein
VLYTAVRHDAAIATFDDTLAKRANEIGLTVAAAGGAARLSAAGTVSTTSDAGTAATSTEGLRSDPIRNPQRRRAIQRLAAIPLD